MELKILEEKESPLLSRKEISMNMTFSGATPSKNDIRKKLASELKADEKLVVVKKVFTDFGNRQARGLAFQYMNEEDMKRIEPKPKAGSKEPGKEGDAAAGKEEAPKKNPKKEGPEEKAKEEKKQVPKEAKKDDKKEAKEEKK